MSGTSADAVDAALVSFADEQQPIVLCTESLALSESLKSRIVACLTDAGTPVDVICDLDVALAKIYATSVTRLLQKADVKPADVEAIGSHGQTLLHQPNGANAFTLQVGDNHLLAELTGMSVVGDFRRRDIAAGGQGAPLVPAFHKTLVEDDQTSAFLNIGGIANVSVIAANHVIGFDTGPGNTLCDAWIRQHQQLDFDADGAWAKEGIINEALLDRLLADPYFSQDGPKSTGQDYFNLTWLHRFDVAALRPEDVQRTLVELTARSAAKALSSINCRCVYICGGGRLNTLMVERLESLLAPAKVVDTHSIGIDPDFMEAIAFAWLAKQCIDGIPGNVPEVTGASGPRVLGVIYPKTH